MCGQNLTMFNEFNNLNGMFLDLHYVYFYLDIFERPTVNGRMT
jgi:hypothetical protein